MMDRIGEQDEMLLNRLLDEELPADEAALLRRRIEQEPALRSVWERLTRIEGLLRARRADACDLNWAGFRASVMNRVEAEAAPVRRELRFPWWLGAAVPLAAAAAVAIVVVLRAPYAERKPATANSGDLRVVFHGPTSGTPEGSLVVTYHRPARAADREAAAAPGPMQVAYMRSSELEEQIRKADMVQDDRPSSHLYIMHADVGASPLEILMELPPL